MHKESVAQFLVPESNGSGQGPVTGSCEHVNEPPSSIKGNKLLCKILNFHGA
jgi:hypothetical protein